MAVTQGTRTHAGKPQLEQANRAGRLAQAGGLGPQEEEEALRLLSKVASRLGHTADGGGLGVGNPTHVGAWAHALGNRRFGQVACTTLAGALCEHPNVRRAATQDEPLEVSLSFHETELVSYPITGATMQEAAEQVPATVGQFDYACAWRTEAAPDVRSRVGHVYLPVEYHYTMPHWTRLGEQPAAIQNAWNRFWNDVMEHEREHLSVCQRYYEDLRATLQELPAAQRTVSRVRQEIARSEQRQNATHRNHTGFVTPATIDCSSYIPPEASAEGEAGEGA